MTPNACNWFINMMEARPAPYLRMNIILFWVIAVVQMKCVILVFGNKSYRMLKVFQPFSSGFLKGDIIHCSYDAYVNPLILGYNSRPFISGWRVYFGLYWFCFMSIKCIYRRLKEFHYFMRLIWRKPLVPLTVV
jgi:hypothetical protein